MALVSEASKGEHMATREIKATWLRVGDEIRCAVAEGDERWLRVREAFWRGAMDHGRRYQVIAFTVEVEGVRLWVERSDCDKVIVRDAEPEVAVRRVRCDTCDREWTVYVGDEDDRCPKCDSAISQMAAEAASVAV